MRFGNTSKLTLSIVLAMLSFLLPWYVSISLVPITILLVTLAQPFRPISQNAHRMFYRFVVYVVTLSLIIVALNGLFITGEGQSLKYLGISFSWEGIMFGLKVSCRLMLLSLAILIFFVSTPISQFVNVLAQLGLSKRIVTIIVLATFYLERLPSRISQILSAQEARGAPVRANIVLRVRSFFSILAPLTLSSIVESIERGVALELRGFRGNLSASHPRDREDSRSALVILLVFVVIFFWTTVWK